MFAKIPNFKDSWSVERSIVIWIMIFNSVADAKLEAVLTNIASIDKATYTASQCSGRGGNIESNISLGCKSPVY